MDLSSLGPECRQHPAWSFFVEFLTDSFVSQFRPEQLAVAWTFFVQGWGRGVIWGERSMADPNPYGGW
jgi:hypothetical protein